METSLPESLAEYVARRPGLKWEKIHAEASRRGFFRLRRGRQTLVAMVYPEPAPGEVEKFCSRQRDYRRHGLRVPSIERVLGNQVVLQEDLGDLLLQRAWRLAGAAERRRLVDGCRRILGRLAAVPPRLAGARLDAGRRKWEMDFFIRHFLPRFPVPAINRERLRAGLHRLAEATGAEETFAHRDFHSRNLLLFKGELALVDFQDSLLAPRYYDLVSLAFDSYLDLGSLRGRLFPNLVPWGDDRELRQMRRTALQRNIKALGTFGFQMFERRHRVYARYVPRTLRHVRGHLQVLGNPEFKILTKYFEAVSRK